MQGKIRHHGLACCATLLLLAGLASCGAGAPGASVVKIGSVNIDREAVERYAASLAGGRSPGNAAKRRALHDQALDFLISSEWVVGEAAERGLAPSASEVEQHFDAKKHASFPGGETEFREFLHQTGRTLADVTLEVKAELAAARLRARATSGDPAITRAETLAYYDTHKAQVTLSERRQVEATNRKTEAMAEALRREVESGKKSFASVAPLRDSVVRPPKLVSGPGLERAIYSAKLDTIVGPVKQRVDYYLLEVTQIVPPHLESFAEVQSVIAKYLAAQRQQKALARFIAAWRQKWIARTSCSPGYIVQKCRQYDGKRAPEAPTSFS
jgi:foldase protein PrsA